MDFNVFPTLEVLVQKINCSVKKFIILSVIIYPIFLYTIVCMYYNLRYIGLRRLVKEPGM